MDWFNEVFDLAAVASGAGLAGGGGAAILAWSIKGAIMRFIVRILFTAVLTGIGFYFLLGWLGFEIVPKDDVTAAARSGSMSAMSAPGNSFLAQDASPELEGAPVQQADDDQKTIIVKSPFRRGG